MTRRIGILLLPILLTGCFARGFDRSDLYGRLKAEQVPGLPEVNETDIVKVQSIKPQLTLPCRVAVYLPPSTGGRRRAKEKEFIDSWAETLKKEGIVTDMFLMSDLFTTGTSLKDLRVAAARHGANLLLVLQGESDVDTYKNPAAVLNLTIVGGFLVPGSRCDALVAFQGALVDVSNGFLYASIDAEGEGSIIRPTFLIEDRPAIERAKEKALANFGNELLKRMRNLHSAMSGQPEVVRAVARP